MKLYTSIERFYLNHFYLLIPLAIILLSCIGGFAVYFITAKGMSVVNFIQMLLCVAGAMFYLPAFWVKCPKKWALRFFFMDYFLSWYC